MDRGAERASGNPSGVRQDEPLRVDHATGDAILGTALNGVVAVPHPHSVLVALALHDDHQAFVEGWCLRLGYAAPDLGLRAVAALSGAAMLMTKDRTNVPFD